MLCPTIAITFGSRTKVNSFALSHHESCDVNLPPTSYVGNNLRDNPNPDTTAPMIIVVRAMHCLSCVFSNTLLLGKLYVRPVLTDNVFKKIIAINIWLLNNLLYNTKSFRTWCHGWRATRYFMRLYAFKWIYHWAHWMEVYFWLGGRRIAHFEKGQTFSDAYQLVNSLVPKYFSLREAFLATRK